MLASADAVGAAGVGTKAASLDVAEAGGKAGDENSGDGEYNFTLCSASDVPCRAHDHSGWCAAFRA